VSIDVNSGRATRERHIDDTALKTNMEAAEEIARQLRLRDLGGLVVIDFIDMESGRHNTKVERRLREAMAEDRARIEIGRISGFGLLELSRQRLHPSLTETHFETCPHCNGTGIIRTVESAAVVAIRALEAEAVKGKVITLTLSVPQAVGLYILNHKRSELNRIEDYFGCHIGVRVDEKLMPSAFEIQNEKGTPVPRIKIEQLPIPHVEGQDPEITEEDMDDEPLMSLGDSRLDDDRETFDDNGDEENPRGRRNIGRNGRKGRFGGSRRGANGRGRRINTEETVPETADPYTNVVSILITEGAPIDGFDGSVAVHEDAIRNPSDTAEKSGRRRNRNRYGNRKPHTRNAQNNDVNNDANNAASGGEGSVDAQTSRTKHVEPVLVSAHDGGGDQGDKNAKRGWWQKLIE
jgi:ribonuclease E